jgi:hypothetical protein
MAGGLSCSRFTHAPNGTIEPFRYWFTAHYVAGPGDNQSPDT